MKASQKHRWSAYLDLFNERSAGKPTRLAVFVEEDRGHQDYWLEDGLPLEGITVEAGADNTDVEMMFGGKAGKPDGHMTHSIRSVNEVLIHLAKDPFDDVLEIEDGEGRRTVLRFEKELLAD